MNDKWLHTFRTFSFLVSVGFFLFNIFCKEILDIKAIIVIGCLAELSLNIGTKWIIEKNRLLPFCPAIRITPLQLLSRFLFDNRIVNNLIVVVMFLSLLFSYIKVGITLLIILCTVDYARYYDVNINLFALIAIVHLDYRSLEIMLGGIYFHAGLSKLISPKYYSETAIWALDNEKRVIENIVQLLPLNPGRKINLQNILFTSYAASSVLLEMTMGLVFLFPISPGLVSTFKLVNLLLHLHIFVFFAIFKDCFSIANWNLWFAAIVQLLPFANETSVGYINIFGFILFVIVPFGLYFGLHSTVSTCHAYYASGWFGRSFLILPKSVLLRVPESVRGEKLLKYTNQRYKQLLDDWMSHHVNISDIATNFNLESVDALIEKTFVLDGDWYDLTTALYVPELAPLHLCGKISNPRLDSWSSFGSTPDPSFFNTIVDYVGENGVYILVDHWALGKRINKVQLLTPENKPHCLE